MKLHFLCNWSNSWWSSLLLAAFLVVPVGCYYHNDFPPSFFASRCSVWRTQKWALTSTRVWWACREFSFFCLPSDDVFVHVRRTSNGSSISLMKSVNVLLPLIHINRQLIWIRGSIKIFEFSRKASVIAYQVILWILSYCMYGKLTWVMVDAIAWKYGNSVIGTWSSKDLTQKGISSIIQFYCTTESSRP